MGIYAQLLCSKRYIHTYIVRLLVKAYTCLQAVFQLISVSSLEWLMKIANS